MKQALKSFRSGWQRGIDFYEVVGRAVVIALQEKGEGTG